MTHDNPSDELAKPLGSQLYGRHSDSVLGKYFPPYALICT